jgi:hypothetical protein
MRRPLLTLLALLTTPTADAADLYWGGHYTTRLLSVDSLSLGSENDRAEGLSSVLDHRLQLRPTWAISPNIGLHAQLDLLYMQPWGAQAATFTDPASGESTALATADGVYSAIDGEDATSVVQTFNARAVWADIYTPLARIRFGRVPVEWGAGLLLNAGDDFNDQYGDTSDRVVVTAKVGAVFLEGAYDLVHEGLLGEADDFHIANLALAWKTENIGIGYLNRYRFQPAQNYGAYTGDIWAKADFGTLKAELEFAFEIGGGDLNTGANDIDIARWGGMLDLSATSGLVSMGMELGIASGDSDLSDKKLTTFTFDRDHDVALLMFQQPMPVLESTVMNESTGGRTLEAVRTGNAVSNAQYLRPWISYAVRRDLSLSAHLLAARADTLDESETTGRGYGMEYGLTAEYKPYEKLIVAPTLALFTPGPYYSEYVDADLGEGFSGPVYGGRLLATVSF